LTRAIDPQTVPGFLTAQEGALLERLAERADPARIVEIGTYCGRSTLYLARGAKRRGAHVLTIDTHRGSEEQQPGQAFHDARLTDGQGRHDSLIAARATIEAAGLSDTISLFVGTSQRAGHWISAPLGLVFIDGGHALSTVMEDWRGFNGLIARGGQLALHDVYPDPVSGGQAPRALAHMILASGLYDAGERCRSLYVFTKT
jgi:MMP 1-O-methyltransferase